MRIKVFMLITLLCVVSVMLFVPTNSPVAVSQTKSKSPATESIQGTTTNQYTLCYLYSNDLTTAQAYKNELNKYGWSVDLVNTNNIGEGNWSNYKLIMLGSDTGNSNGWSNSSEISYLNNLNISFLALGGGGLSFYGNNNGGLGLPINYGSSAENSATSVFSYNSTTYDTYFNTPFKLNNPLTITSSQLYFEYYLSGNPPSGVELIGGDSSHTSYYPIAVENQRYGVWGLTGAPTTWTLNGEQLFENLLIHLTGVNPDSASTGLQVSPSSLVYEVGTTDHILQMQATSIDPNNYTIYENGTSFQSGSWASNVNITASIDGLSVGTYNFTTVVETMFYNSTSATVLVQVIPGPTTTTATTTKTTTATTTKTTTATTTKTTTATATKTTTASSSSSTSNTSNVSSSSKTSPSFEFMSLVASLGVFFLLRKRIRRK